MTQKRPHWYDFKIATVEDLRDEQLAAESVSAFVQNTASGSGIKTIYPTERIIFSSESMTVNQASWASLDSFDGRGILESSHLCTDSVLGNQIAVTLSDSGVSNFLPFVCTVLGTDFDDNLQYEHLTLKTNGYQSTYRHFKTVENILFQNYRGNTDTRIDGYGSFDLGGIVVVAESSAVVATNDFLVANQSAKPDMIFAKYKLYDPAETLNTILTEAVRSAYSISSLDIDTDVVDSISFSAGAANDIIYAQKFKANSDNIQAVELLVKLTGASWSGSLTVGVRALQTADTFAGSTRYLPNNAIDFDPEQESLSEVSLNSADLLNQGIVLNGEYQTISVPFSSTPVASSINNGLVTGNWYALTIRRTGSTATGSLSLPNMSVYTGNTGYTVSLFEDTLSCGGRIAIRSGGFWSDIPTNTTWYRVLGNAVKIASGSVVDSGVVSDVEKTGLNSSTGLVTQRSERGVTFATSTTDVDNFVVAQSTLVLSDLEAQPKTGDLIASREQNKPIFSALNESDFDSLLATNPETVLICKAIDTNPRGNPTIAGSLRYPGLAIGNIVDIPLPPMDLVNYDVVGSIFTPNSLKPSLRYRITGKQIVVDGYGDIDSDGIISLNDLELVDQFDGYSVTTTGGVFSQSQHIALLKSKELEMIDLIKSNLNSDSLINSTDGAALSAFITAGTAFPNGLGEFTRVRLTLEPLTDRLSFLSHSGSSTLAIEDLDTDLLSTWTGAISWSIEPVVLWREENVKITDLRKKVISVTTSTSKTEPGKNNQYIPGDILLEGNVLNSDGTPHRLDYERAVVEIELPAGTTEKELNIFSTFVSGKMKFSDGTTVSASAIANKQLYFEVQVSSYAKNLGFGVDGYTDYSGVGDSADEAIGTYIDQATGLLRIRAYNIVNNLVLPEIRTRIYVTCNLKKAGWTNERKVVSATELAALLS